MITRKLFDDFTKVWREQNKNDPSHEAKADLGYAFFLAGVGAMASGLGALIETGATLAAQKVAEGVKEDCYAEVSKLKEKYCGKEEDIGINFGEFKL